MIPVSRKVSRRKGLGVIVKALTPGLNTMPSTVVLVETVTPVILERSKVTVSADPLGTDGGVQFSAVFQSLLIGFMLKVALSAYTAFSTPNPSVTMMTQDRMGVFTAAIMPTAPFESEADS